MIELVCSNRRRPSVQTQRGSQWWTRDVFHAAGALGETLCGRDAVGWLAMDPRPREEVLADQHFCRRCAAVIEKFP